MACRQTGSLKGRICGKSSNAYLRSGKSYRCHWRATNSSFRAISATAISFKLLAEFLSAFAIACKSSGETFGSAMLPHSSPAGKGIGANHALNICHALQFQVDLSLDSAAKATHVMDFSPQSMTLPDILQTSVSITQPKPFTLRVSPALVGEFFFCGRLG